MLGHVDFENIHDAWSTHPQIIHGTFNIFHEIVLKIFTK